MYNLYGPTVQFFRLNRQVYVVHNVSLSPRTNPTVLHLLSMKWQLNATVKSMRASLKGWEANIPRSWSLQVCLNRFENVAGPFHPILIFIVPGSLVDSWRLWPKIHRFWTKFNYLELARGYEGWGSTPRHKTFDGTQMSLSDANGTWFYNTWAISFLYRVL